MKHVQTDAIQRKVLEHNSIGLLILTHTPSLQEADMFTSDYEMYDTMQLIERLEVAEKKTGTG